MSAPISRPALDYYEFLRKFDPRFATPKMARKLWLRKKAQPSFGDFEIAQGRKRIVLDKFLQKFCSIGQPTRFYERIKNSWILTETLPSPTVSQPDLTVVHYTAENYVELISARENETTGEYQLYFVANGKELFRAE